MCTQANAQVYATEAHADRDTNSRHQSLHWETMASFRKESRCVSYYGLMRQFPKLHQAGLCHAISCLLQELEDTTQHFVHEHQVRWLHPSDIAMLAAKNKRGMNSIWHGVCALLSLSFG